ncbi:MAG: hypothetical protein ACKOXM_00385 [Agromyces sp.]
MNARVVSARVLFVVAVPVLFFALIDALEGGLVLLLAGAVYAVAFALAKTAPPRSVWIPYLVAVLLAVATLLAAFLTRGADPGPSGFSILPVIGNWLYRGAVVVTLLVGVMHAVRSFRR